VARRPAGLTANRDDILLAAADVLMRRGYAATTMKEIAAAANLTAGTLYHYFANKDALLLAVLETGLEAGIARVEGIACDETRPALDRLRDMIAAHILGLTEQPAIGAAMVFEIRALLYVSEESQAGMNGFAEEFTRRREAFFRRRDDFERLFRQVVMQAVADGALRPMDAGIYVKTLLGAQNWVGVWYRPEGRLSGEDIAARMVAFLIEGARP
jgi:TetR/AcrR family transcriptional regulator, cholesterol catabolism regulator